MEHEHQIWSLRSSGPDLIQRKVTSLNGFDSFLSCGHVNEEYGFNSLM